MSFLLLLIGGDFNLLRSPSDKNNGNFSWPLVESFNDFISDCALREIPRVGARFTWSNHQLNPVYYVLDRVFVNVAWDSTFPCASLVAQPHIGSDHSPLFLDARIASTSVAKRFQFEASWLLVEGFQTMLSDRISNILASMPRSFGSIDDWHFCSYQLRKFLKGWGRNRAAEAHRAKDDLQAKIVALDLEADLVGLSQAGWQSRYDLEGLLMQLHRQEEIYWRQWGTINWTLKGDSLTSYFLAITNGRRRRCLIENLLVQGVRILDPAAIMQHVRGFF